MPFATTALAVAAVVSAGLGATELGMNLAGVGQPDRHAPSTTPQPLTAQQNRQEQAAVSGALPDIQSMTGGSISPEYAAQFGALQTGLANDPQAAGNIQAAINQFFGLTAPGNTGLTSTTSGTGGSTPFDFLKNASASPATRPQTSPGGDFVSENINSDLFKGLVS